MPEPESKKGRIRTLKLLRIKEVETQIDGQRRQKDRELVAEGCKCMSGGQVRSVTTEAGWATPVSMTN